MAKAGSAATSFSAAATVSGPNWKFSMRAWRSASRFRASADFVVHSNLPDLVAAGAAAAAAKTRETARAETRFIILIELLVQMRERTCPEVSRAGSSQYTRASRRQVPWAGLDQACGLGPGSALTRS